MNTPNSPKELMELNDKNNRPMVDRCIDALKELDPTVADMLEVAQQNVEAMYEYHKMIRDEARANESDEAEDWERDVYHLLNALEALKLVRR